MFMVIYFRDIKCLHRSDTLTSLEPIHVLWEEFKGDESVLYLYYVI